jgi:ABC-type Fe3+-siderophore transport system permease subunit
MDNKISSAGSFGMAAAFAIGTLSPHEPSWSMWIGAISVGLFVFFGVYHLKS